MDSRNDLILWNAYKLDWEENVVHSNGNSFPFLFDLFYQKMNLSLAVVADDDGGFYHQ
jgi:hypothetical protein